MNLVNDEDQTEETLDPTNETSEDQTSASSEEDSNEEEEGELILEDEAPEERDELAMLPQHWLARLR